MKNELNSNLKRNRRQYLANILVLGVTLMVIAIIGEIFMRLYLPTPKFSGRLHYKQWNRDFQKPPLIPNSDVIYESVPVKTNAWGLRNKEIDLEKGQDTYRILLFGDSFTFGRGVSFDGTISSQLEKRLNKYSSNFTDVQVLNFGVSGMNTFEEVMYALNYGLRFDPDIIMIVWIYNDIQLKGYSLKDLDYFVKNGTVPRESLSLTGLSTGKKVRLIENEKGFIMNFWNLYEKMKNQSKLLLFLGIRTKEMLQKLGLNLKSSENIMYSNLDSEGFQLVFNSLQFINHELRRMGVEFHTILYPPLQKLDDDYYDRLINKKVEKMCLGNGINCLNLFENFLGKKPSELHVSKTDYHPNKRANGLASKALEKYLKQNSSGFREFLENDTRISNLRSESDSVQNTIHLSDRRGSIPIVQ